MILTDSTKPPSDLLSELNAPQRKHERQRRTSLPPSGGIGHYAAFTIAPTIELEVHIAGATAVRADGRAAGGSRWVASGWQLVERHRGSIMILAGQRGNFSTMWIAIDLVRRSTNPTQLRTSLSALSDPCIDEDPDV